MSAASVWETEIKVASGKSAARLRARRRAAVEHGFAPLDDHRRARRAPPARLPRHHGDPCDRMLVAQAQLEGLTIVTRDPVFSRYQVAVLAA